MLMNPFERLMNGLESLLTPEEGNPSPPGGDRRLATELTDVVSYLKT
jgi:hypothetical protein